MPRARSICGHNAPVPCGNLAVRDGRCAVHAAEKDASRGNRHVRGYGANHERTRIALMLDWWRALRRGAAWVCPRCEQPLAWGTPVDADHWDTRPPAPPDRLSHASCNRGKRLPQASGEV